MRTRTGRMFWTIPNFEPLWVLSLPRIIHPSITPSAEAPIGVAPIEEVPIAEAPNGEVPIGEAPSAKAPSGTGQQCLPDSTENGDLEDNIDALERLSAQLVSDKIRKKPPLQKLLNAMLGRKNQFVEPVSLQQEQQLEDPLCGDIEQLQESVEKSLLNWHQSKRNSDYEVLDNESEQTKVQLQPNDINHTSSSCFREQAGGSRVSPEPSSDEKQLKHSTSSKSSESNASEFSSRIVEPNVESTVFIGKEVNGTAVGVSRLDTISGADLQEGDVQDTGTDQKTLLNKLAETCEQESSAVSTKGGASVGLEVETNPVHQTEGDLQGRCNTIVKVECPVPQAVVVPAGGSAHDSWTHDAVRCRYGRDALGRASANGFETTEEKEVACKVKVALWQGMCCSSQSGGLGPDLFERVQLFVQSKMHFHRESDDTMLLTTDKPGEVIRLGKCKNDIEAGAARRILSRCKKELQKCIKFFERQSLVSSGAVAQAADSSPKVIVLDDDDGNEVPVAPVASVVPDSTSARAFADVTSMTNNIGAQREGTVQGNRACRTSGLLNDVVSAHPRQAQEEHCHVAGGSYAGGYIGVRQAVPNNIQIIKTNSYPMQSVVQTRGSPNAQMHGRTPQPVREGSGSQQTTSNSQMYERTDQPLRQGPGNQQTTATAFMFANVVRQQQPMNQYDEYALADSSGRQVETPSSHLQPMQGPVRAFTSHGPVNHPRELGNSNPEPTAFNISAAAAPRSTLMRRVYNCCPGIESSNEDFMLFKALCCTTCNRLVHIDCAIALHQIRFIQYLGKERAVYTCQCQKIWEIIPQILNRMKEFTYLIWNQQKERLNRGSTPLSVIQFDNGQELNVIMVTLLKILSLTRGSWLRSILEFVEYMIRNMWVDANRVSFLEWIQFLDAALIKMTMQEIVMILSSLELLYSILLINSHHLQHFDHHELKLSKCICFA